MFCVDASVLISAAKGNEPYSQQSRDFLNLVKREEYKMLVPEILIPEVASGLVRATTNAGFSVDFVKAIRLLPNFVFVPVDTRLADRAATIILETKLRGADAIYVAVALVYGVPLITLDEDQLAKANKLIEVRRPTQ